MLPLFYISFFSLFKTRIAIWETFLTLPSYFFECAKLSCQGCAQIGYFSSQPLSTRLLVERKVQQQQNEAQKNQHKITGFEKNGLNDTKD
jgi:hypothetical protein